MKTTFNHIPFAMLTDFAESRASADERIASAAHLSACSQCAGELQRLRQVMELMRTDTSADAPRDVLAYAINIFRAREQSSQPSLLRRIVAALSFDSSLDVAPAFGVRSGQTTTRQLLFSAEENDIDLRISSRDDQWLVAGQLLGRRCVGGRVELAGENGSAESGLNDLCEFTLPPVSAGSYTLRLRIGDADIEIPQLELRA